MDKNKTGGGFRLFPHRKGSRTKYATLFLAVSILTSIAIGGLHSIGDPIQVYPLFENGFRARRGQTVVQNNAESARLYADFAQVAASHPYSWNFGKPPKTAAEIGTVGPKNRMICFPCTNTTFDKD